MDKLLNRLCDILGDELERQENVLAQCRAQQQAIRARDVDGIADRSIALQVLLAEAAEAEPQRFEVLRQVVDRLHLPVETCTLTHLVQAAPEPWSRRLKHHQDRLNDVLGQSRVLARENAVLLRRSIRLVGQCLQRFQPNAPAPSGSYTASGREAAALRRPATLLNQRG